MRSIIDSLALKLADRLLVFVGRGDHTDGYNERIADARSAVAEMQIYFAAPQLARVR